MTLREGTILQGGRYRITRFISSGGFGCTYEAEDTVSNKRVALKEFFVKDFCNRDENTLHVTVGTQSKKGLVEKLKRKFVDEARVLQEMNHPGIVSVFEVFEDYGTAYFVMDYIDGPSLNDIVNREGALTESRAVRYIRQAANALLHVHEHNRLHLDIKPHNIMVDSKDNAILIDFGASKQYDEQDGENTSTLIGKTPGYAPLEQMGNDVVKFMPATDIYALAATLYKLLTAKTPLSANMLASGEELEPLPDNISLSVREAILKSMSVNKNKRPQTIPEFLALLGVDEPVVESCDEKIIADDSEATLIVDGPKPEVSQPEAPKHGSATQAPIVEKSPSKKKSQKGGLVVAGCLILVLFLIVRSCEKQDEEFYKEAYRKATETEQTIQSTPAKSTQSVVVDSSFYTPTTTTSSQPSEVKSQKTNQANTISAPVVEPTDKNASLLKKALKDKDYTVVQKLANEGYAAAYGPLAKYYLQNHDYKTAEKYAKKAKAAGYSDGTTVLNTLKNLGYYD